MTSKKTVVIPKRFLTSIPIAFILTICVLYLLHLFGEWKNVSANIDWSAPENKGMISIPTKLDGFWNSCGINNTSHYVQLAEPTLNWKPYETNFNSLKLSSSFTNTFDKHFTFIILFSLIGSAIVYFIRGLNFKVVDTNRFKVTSDFKQETPANNDQIILQQRYDNGEISFETYQNEWNKLNI